MLGCFSRLRRPATASAPPPLRPTTTPHSEGASTSASTSVASATTSPSSSSSVLFKNFSSVYVDDDYAEALAKDPSAPSVSAAIAADDDLSSAIASRRFFLSSPGRSNSIVDSAHAAGVVSVGVGVGVGAAGVAVPTYSPDPHGDFLRSMEEMVAALGLDARQDSDRAHLHELLLCYLALNKKNAHKYIVSAFTELLLRLTAVQSSDAGEQQQQRKV